MDIYGVLPFKIVGLKTLDLSDASAYLAARHRELLHVAYSIQSSDATVESVPLDPARSWIQLYKDDF